MPALAGRGALAALVTAYVIAAVAGLGLLVWSGLAPPQRQAVGAALGSQVAAILVGAGVLGAGLALLLLKILGVYAVTARRLAADTRLLGANPDHQLPADGPPEISELAEAVGQLAERRRVAEREVTRQVSAARADVEQERNRLAALMAELAVAVLVCNLEGRILLYNSAARSLLQDDPAMGLGRSVFGILDRGLVTHALERIQEGSAAHVATALRGHQLLQVRLAPVHGPDRALTGFVLVLEDQTDRVQIGARRDALIRQFSEGTRASLGSIRAAIESVLDYPDMDAEERRAFVEIVRDESERLGAQVERWFDESASYVGEEWLLTDMRGADLLTVLRRELERDRTVAVSIEPGGDEFWLKVDSHAVARAAVHLAACLREECGVESLTVSLSPAGRHGQLDARWDGRSPDPDAFRTWLDQQLTGGAASVREVVERHGGEIWCGDGPGGSAYLRMLLPLTTATTPPAAHVSPDVGSRPEFYDFALFDLPEESLAWQERSLADLAYTVFDTETTGLDPATDEIISIGAVRVVNGRLLRGEAFDRLVDPQRPVPGRAVAVHGITTEMVRGQPSIDQVLPLFARYAEDTVLVGHNVGFDMRLLREKEGRTGVRFAQPVLDTLLLDAAVHPDHEAHSLEAIAARLGIDVVDRHSALGDALVTGEVFLLLLNLLQQRGMSTLGEALSASRATLQARADASLYGGR